ncbi:MAG TPA: sigma-70 family RNA polymerase sigma factor [Isosphaeraceae bacterium]|jgi:RNA polymerase sigma factor (sigma-70 family)|nr:sigma-70 family RNA polymerase sigma factor [Isosphaeraceae bacterium]
MVNAPKAAAWSQLDRLYNGGAVAGLADGQLLDRFVARRDEAAFAALVGRHGPMVLGVCRGILRDGHDAEDAFQAVFLALARKAGSIRGRSVGAWLYRVAYRVARRANVAAARRRALEREALAMSPPTVPAVAGADRDGDDLRPTLLEEVERLPDSLRAPVVLCYFSALSYEQAAQELGTSESTIRGRLARARGRLRARLSRRGVTLAPAVLGTLLVQQHARAAVPAAWAEAAVRAATTAGAASAAASALTEEVLKTMAMTQLKTIAAVAVTLGGMAGLAAWTFAAPRRPADPLRVAEPGPQAAPKSTATPPAATAQQEPGARKLSASGQVRDEAGRPIAGAKVYLREWTSWRVRRMNAREIDRIFHRGEAMPDVLAEATTDRDGRFAFKDVAAPPFVKEDDEPVDTKVFPWDVVAIAPGRALDWAQLTPRNRREPIALTLGRESAVSGRLVDPDGKPVAGVRVAVGEVASLVESKQLQFDPWDPTGRLDLANGKVPVATTTDADGRFRVAGLPRDRRISLVAQGDGIERSLLYAATTATPQPDKDNPYSRGGKAGPERYHVSTGDFTYIIERANHRIVGRVVFDETGKPAAGADVLRGNWPVGKTDADGRFTIDNLPAGTHDIHVMSWKSDATAAGADVEVPRDRKVVEHTFRLPKGAVISGRVVEEDTGKGVAKVQLSFEHHLRPGEMPSSFGFMGETDADGRFKLVAPPGSGRLRIFQVPDGYVPDTPRTTPPVGGAGPAVVMPSPHERDLEPEVDRPITDLTFTLSRGLIVKGRALDPDGKPVAGASVNLLQRGLPRPAPTTDADGRFELIGLDPAIDHEIDVVHPARHLAARVRVPDADRINPAKVDIRLKATASLAARVLDEVGQPLPNAIFELVAIGDVEPRFGNYVPVAGTEVAKDGSFTIDGLIPDVDYLLYAKAEGHAKGQSPDIRLKPGERLKLPDFRLPITDREVKGVVVDPRGKPLAGISVSVDRSNTTIYPSGTWFMETDADGRFHLDGLPRGPITLMAYRHSEPGQPIRDIHRVELADGQAEARIEMADPK